MFLFSFLTITYNRPELIERLYKSIIDSHINNNLFEWTIIINGRYPNLETINKIRMWKIENKINISTYIIEINQGLTNALNFFNNIPTTSFYVMRLDDDDVLDSVIFPMVINTLNDNKHLNYLGFILNMKNHSGKIIGSELPKDKIPRSNFYFHYIYNVKGDKSRIYPTQVIKRFSYKIHVDESFSPDSQVYYQMDSVLKLIPINLSPVIREYLPDGVTKNSSKLLVNNIQSIVNSNMELLKHPEARLQDKIRIFLVSIKFVIISKKYRMINKIRPICLSWITFILLYPSYKIYVLIRKYFRF
jgi:hypothetical protein